jgi:hypothetical protein
MTTLKTKKLTLNRESLRLLATINGKRQLAEDPPTEVGHSCDSFCY